MCLSSLGYTARSKLMSGLDGLAGPVGLVRASSTGLTCCSQTVSQSEPHPQLSPESEAAWRSGGWAKGTKTKEKRWMVWVRRWKRAWWTIHYWESLLSGGCHWPSKFMIWKTGRRRHAVMDGGVVNEAVHTFILDLQLALLHMCEYVWHESWVHLCTLSLQKYTSEREGKHTEAAGAIPSTKKVRKSAGRSSLNMVSFRITTTRDWLPLLPLSSCKGRNKVNLSNKLQRCERNRSHWQAGKPSGKQFAQCDWF